MDRLHYCHLAESFTLTSIDVNRRIYNKKFSCQISIKRLLKFHDLINV